MNDLQTSVRSVPNEPALPCPAADSRWYAVYTCANHEKTVAQQLELRSIESFLPLYEKVSRWKDRRVKLQLPLFSGYLFVRTMLAEKLRVLQVPGVVCLVGLKGNPTPLVDDEIEAIRWGLTKLRAEPHPFLRVGHRVRIKSGPLAGLEGILLRKKGNCRFVLSLELIQRSISADIDIADVAVV